VKPRCRAKAHAGTGGTLAAAGFAQARKTVKDGKKFPDPAVSGAPGRWPQRRGPEGAVASMSAHIFLSTVSDEFLAYRDQLRSDLTRHNVEVKVQEDFNDLGGDTLDKLDVYIAHAMPWCTSPAT
jgi:hypothetical protein